MIARVCRVHSDQEDALALLILGWFTFVAAFCSVISDVELI
jgi:hypothetical protein